MGQEAAMWFIFCLVIGGMLVLDLGVFDRKAHEIRFKEALFRSCMWIGLALLFNLFVLLTRGRDAALTFLAGYLLEESLSVDNLFVFLLVFSYFRVPPVYQHKVLFWGILGAVLFRGFFIASGVALIHRFHWLVYLFGLFLIFTGIKLFLEKDKHVEPEKNPILRLFRSWVPVTKDYERERFFVKRDGRLWATPLFIVLIVIETTDIVFAVDSIPAVLAITTDPFIVYTSNIFAILGLRSLYFALAGLMKLFHHLHYGLSVILVFVGFKMLIGGVVEIPIAVALGVIIVVLAASVVASILWPEEVKVDRI